MSWIWTAIKLRIGWAFGELLMFIGILALLFLAVVVWAVVSTWLEKRRKKDTGT